MNLHSFIVTGPESWTLYTKKSYSGDSVKVGPGRYDKAWIDENLQDIKSAYREYDSENSIVKKILNALSDFQL